MIPYNPNLKQYAKDLRNNMTPEERHIWYDFLKKLPFDVKRQHRIENYIVDFYIPEKKIVIEIDGIQHLTEDNKKADSIRDESISEWGITVIRIPNKLINKNFNDICEYLLKRMEIDFSTLK